jgi:hypothetical protein
MTTASGVQSARSDMHSSAKNALFSNSPMIKSVSKEAY